MIVTLNVERVTCQRLTGERGFTLIELMVAVTILVIIGGTAYTSYNAAIKVYQKHQARMETVQKCRAALEQIARDLENLFFIEQDEDLLMTSEDYQNEEGMDQDTISFVRVIDPRYEFYQFVQTQQQEGWTLQNVEQAEGTPVNTDLIRVGYMIAEDPNLAEREMILSTLGQTSQAVSPYSLYRITTHTLNYDDGLSQVFEGEVSPADLIEAEEAQGQEYQTMYQSESQLKATGESEAVLKAEVIAENVLMLDLKYFDGEDWLDYWDMQEQGGQLPKAVMITLSVTDEKGKVTVTEMTIVHLNLSKETASQGGAMPGAQPFQGGGGP
ncbi:prepilin-type N-terminal cleavage/methylation domain-containing protein [Candidatus Poribacteria bacterium]|nr:prepilin-type N-terminal cleavage/methylation domain-containing protein [Candidatus Poribacteria bacterium]